MLRCIPRRGTLAVRWYQFHHGRMVDRLPSMRLDGVSAKLIWGSVQSHLWIVSTRRNLGGSSCLILFCKEECSLPL